MMEPEEIYQEAYIAHYKKKNYNKAIQGYLEILEGYPNSNEARYAHQQLYNLKDKISIENLNITESQRNILNEFFYIVQDQEDKKEKRKAEYEQQEVQKKLREKEKLAEERIRLKKIDNIPLTTTMNIDGYKVKKYIDIESVEVVIGTGIISEVVSDFSDAFGMRSTPFESKLAQAKAHALKRLKYIASSKGGDAVIGVDIDYTEFSGNKIGVIVSGTIVKLDPPFDFDNVK